MAKSRSSPTLIFGKPLNKYTVDLVRKILSALGHQTTPGKPQSRKREDLLERLQSVEKDLTEVERLSICYLLKTNSAISQPAFIEELHGLIKTKPVLECQICAETKPSTSFHLGKLTPNCNHFSPICKSCLKTYINTQLKDRDWQAINCLVCSSTLPTDIVKLYTTSQVFER